MHLNDQTDNKKVNYKTIINVFLHIMKQILVYATRISYYNINSVIDRFIYHTLKGRKC